MKDFQVFSNVPEIYNNMLRDIESAREFVYLETYIFDNDPVGKKFVEILVKKAKQGIKIKLLVDSWGLTTKKTFFEEIVNSGGEVRFFRELRYVIRLFSKNHERNHRKLLLIDNRITYIGSLNIGQRFLKWRELVIRLSGEITAAFVKSFMKSWESFGNFNSKRIKSLFHKGYQIIQDFPSSIHRVTEKKYIELITRAKKEIRIETPFFIPTENIMEAFVRAIKREVKIIIIVPYRSDILLADVLRDRYLGRLHRKGIGLYYYQPNVLHSKLLIVDDKFFLLGSSNMDYRSFIHQYEINFFGKNPVIVKALKDYSNGTLSQSKPFNYPDWKKRSSLTKLIEIFLHFIRRFL